jgi:hypothetical protein
LSLSSRCFGSRNFFCDLSVDDGGVLEQAEAHAHIDPMQALCETNTESAEALVLMCVALYGILLRYQPFVGW